MNPGSDTDLMLDVYMTAAQREAYNRLRKDAERYRTARCMTPHQWSAAWELNEATGKPFDEIIDNMRNFVGRHVEDNPRQVPSDKCQCYGCLEYVTWLAPDSRCSRCTRLSPDDE